MGTKAYNEDHLIVFLFIIFFFTKLAIISHLPLINDEAYTLTISKYFSLSYFDHPPLMMWVSYFLHYLEINSLYLFRIPFLLFGLFTSFFIYKIAAIIYSKETGTIAAFLYFISPFFFFSGGLFIVPDALLNFSVAGTTYLAIKIIFENKNKAYLWFLLGVLLSIAFLSKYQSYLYGLSLFAAFIVWKRDAFFNYSFYMALFISICGLLPVILWNIENGFASFHFHQNRGAFNFNFFHIINSLLAQLLFILPTTVILIVLGVANFIKHPSSRESFLAVLALPTILIFNVVIMGSENSFAHWSMMGWMLLIPIASKGLILLKSNKTSFLALKTLNILLVYGVILVILIHSKTGILTKTYGQNIPYWDNTRELLDWGNISDVLEENLKENELKSLSTLDWYDSGQLASAFNYEYSVGVIGSNSHHFKFIDKKGKKTATLINVRLLNSNTEINLADQMATYGFKINKRVDLPYFRGNQKYGSIIILYIEKVQ